MDVWMDFAMVLGLGVGLLAVGVGPIWLWLKLATRAEKQRNAVSVMQSNDAAVANEVPRGRRTA